MKNLILIAFCIVISSCAQHVRVHFQVIDFDSGRPIPEARLESNSDQPIEVLKLSSLFRPEWSYRKNPEATTDEMGQAWLEIPLKLNSHKRFPKRHPDYGKNRNSIDFLGPSARVEKSGYYESSKRKSIDFWNSVAADSETVTIKLKQISLHPNLLKGTSRMLPGQ